MSKQKTKKTGKLWDYEKVLVRGNVVIAFIIAITVFINLFVKSMYIAGVVHGMTIYVWFVIVVTMHNILVTGKNLKNEWKELEKEIKEMENKK